MNVNNFDDMVHCDENISFEVEVIPTEKVEKIIKNALCSATVADNLWKLSGKSSTA